MVALATALCGTAIADVEPTWFPADWPHACPWKLERELIEAEHVLFALDHLRGGAPNPEALDHLVRVAAGHVRGGQASWSWLGQAAAAGYAWMPGDRPAIAVPSGAGGEWDAHELAEWTAQRLVVPTRALGSSIRVVPVRYVGTCGRSYGFVGRSPTNTDGSVAVIYLCQDTIAAHTPFGFTRTYFEKRALVHELGHALGLATNPAHGRWTSRATGGFAHCVNPQCAVALPTPLALLAGEMLDFCADCRQDLEQARRHWREGATFDEVPRLPRPDFDALVGALRKRHFVEGGEAEHLARYGRDAIPALMARLESLPGGRHASPRAYAARLVTRMLVDALLVAGHTEPGTRFAMPQGDLGPQLLAWWERERTAFLEGESWQLPDFVQLLDGPTAR